ncbi:MAG: hypothetical protein K5907_00090, partial [Treponema sp.]|nr:hypothetical protein [Treponema sp.]
MSKTSVKASLFKLRSLAAAVVLFFAAQMGWGATYYWVGGNTGNWNDAVNWSTSEGGTGGTGDAYPGYNPSDGDEVHIYGDVDVTIASDISIGKLLISSGTNHLTSSFTTKLSGTGSLTITNTYDSINLTRCSTTDDVIGTLEINLPVTCKDTNDIKGTIQTHSGTTLLVDAGKTLTAADVIHNATSGKPVSKIQIEGTLDAGTVSLNLSNNANLGSTQLVVGSNGKVNTGEIKFGRNDYSNTSSDGTTTKITEPIINNGIITISNTFTIPDFSSEVTIPYSGNGTIALNGADAKFIYNDYVDITVAELTGGTQNSTVTGGGHITITSATFNGSATVSGTTIADVTFKDDITLSGTNTFTKFNASGLGGKTFTVAAAQTINGATNEVLLSGTSSTNLLNITGSGSFVLSNPLIADYLSFDTISPSATAGKAYAKNSTGTADGWTVASGELRIWNGSTTDWGTLSNWLPQSLPDGNADVIIPATSYEPTVSSDAAVKSIITAVDITVAAGTKFEITEGTALSDKIKGAGTLVLSSGKTYTMPDPLTINIENNGTISGDATINGNFSNTGTGSVAGTVTVSGNVDHSGGTINSLVFTGTGDKTFTPQNTGYTTITVNKESGTLTVSDALQAQNLTLTAGDVLFAGNVTVDTDFATTHNITFADGTYTLSAKTITAASISAQNNNETSLTLQSDDGDIIIGGDIGSNSKKFKALVLDPDSKVKLGGNIILGSADDAFVINYPLILTGNTNFDVTGNIKIEDSVTPARTGSINSDSTARELSLKAGTGKSIQIKNGAASGAGLGASSPLSKITINSSLSLDAETSFTTSGDDGTVFAGTGSVSTTGTGTLVLNGNLSNTGSWTFGTDISVTGDVTDTGTWNGSNKLSFIGGTDHTFIPGTSTYHSIEHTGAGLLIIDGTLNAGSAEIASLSINGKIITDTEGITISGTTTLTGDSEFETPAAKTINFGGTVQSSGASPYHSLTTKVGTVQFDGEVSKVDALITAAAVINTTSISSDTQTYNGAVNFLQSAELTATTVTFKNNVSGTGLEVDGNTVVNTGVINTTGNQTYNGTVTLDRAAVLTARTTGATPVNQTITFKGNVSSSADITLEADVSIGAAEITLASDTQIKLAGDISGSGKTLTLNTPVFNSTKASASDVTVGTLNLAHAVALTSTAGINLTASSITKTAGSNYTLTNNAALSVSDEITIYPDFINETGTLTASSGTTTFKGNVTLPASSFTHSGGEVVLSPTEGSMAIDATATFNKLTAADLGAKTINFASGTALTVEDKLTLTGDNTNNLTLTSTGTWGILCTKTEADYDHVISHVTVKNSNNTSSYFLTATDITDEGGNSKWNFPGMEYTWKGSAGDTNGHKWYYAANWTPASIPGTGS